MWCQCLLPLIEICFLICMHRETPKFKQSILTLVSSVSSIGITDNSIIPRQWPYMRIWNRLNAFCFIIYTHFSPNVRMLYIVEHTEVVDEFITENNPNLTRFYIIKSRPRSTKNTDMSGTQRSGSPGHIWKNAYLA